ncbi:LysR family transcriptional regulator [Bosea sp. BK604]|uniref:LysR family transcriptional regulator n=1 Tax=Bosea sp. BK604 TaxID=2512180 RepID=UPI00104E3956|nr:LysR family transcriptional regulator [Bosea sp. BK604]TCR66350.1 LysR family transcriptional regulator [Bosea sp. BK604]
MKSIRLDSLDVFASIVSHGGFRAAAAERGVSSAALSQSITSLEAALGIRLLNRTTRSVAPTEAGARLLERLAPALQDIRLAIDDLNALREKPTGTLRINAPGPAVDHILCPLAFDFMRSYPDVKVELISDAAIVDIVQQGFDAGVRFGRQLEQDMIAVPLGPPLRYAIVASPDYLTIAKAPATPQDLIGRDCIRRRFPGGTLASWRFARDGEVLEISPEGRLTLSSAHQELQAALAGQGIAHVFEAYAKPHLDDGSLIELLRDWSPGLPSWFLYYPNRRHPSAAMAALLQHIRSFDWSRADQAGIRPAHAALARKSSA